MNGYGLIAAIVQSIASLAWPAAMVAIVFMFRDRIEELLPNLQAKIRDVEISFRLNQAAKEAAALASTSGAQMPDFKPTPEETDRFEQIANVSPRAAITEVRRDLEEALGRVARQHGFEATLRPMSGTIRILRSKGIIDTHTSALLDDLRAVGNAAVHASTETEFLKEDALRYRRLADEVMVSLAFSRTSSIGNEPLTD